MSCKRYHLWLSELVDGELGDRERALLREHLEQCATCRSHSVGNHRLSLQLQSWQPPAPSSELPGAFSRRLQEEIVLGRREPFAGPPWRRGRARAVLGLSGAIALVLLLAGRSGMESGSPQAEAPARPVVANAQMVHEATRSIRLMDRMEIRQRLQHASQVVRECLRQPRETPVLPAVGPGGSKPEEGQGASAPEAEVKT